MNARLYQSDVNNRMNKKGMNEYACMYVPNYRCECMYAIKGINNMTAYEMLN